MKLDFSGKTVLVTGASRGIGRALAFGFRNAGAVVYGTGTKPESVEWMASEKIEGRAADVAESGAMETVIKEIVAKHGKLDVLVNNAGIATNTPASSIKDADMERMISVNFKGVFKSCQAYYKAQKKHGGTVVNVSSILGQVGFPLAAVYCGTKGAVIQMTRALAVEWAGSAFRINALCPGFIDTDMTEMIKEKPEIMDYYRRVIPMKRLGTVDDMVGPTLFLAHDVSRYMTGQCLVVDGGVTAT
ncbi:MAG: SDR family oxidoreductase [Spirochaetia bacterium]|nr:SDR family oxidoreductase [Spirochaetia bacterium]